jgi:NhaP-type Na+/H+ or K+/H+ antiporter
VLAATLGDATVSWRHRVLLAVLAPRGLMAASLIYIFLARLRMTEQIHGAELFSLTVAAIGLTAIVGSAAAACSRRWVADRDATVKAEAGTYRLGDKGLET